MNSFGGFRDWLFLAIFGALVAGGSGLVHDVYLRLGSADAEIAKLRDKHEADLRELRERWNSEYQGILTTQGQNGERLGKIETELRVEHSDLAARLDRIEAKLNR